MSQVMALLVIVAAILVMVTLAHSIIGQVQVSVEQTHPLLAIAQDHALDNLSAL